MCFIQIVNSFRYILSIEWQYTSARYKEHTRHTEIADTPFNCNYTILVFKFHHKTCISLWVYTVQFHCKKAWSCRILNVGSRVPSRFLAFSIPIQSIHSKKVCEHESWKFYHGALVFHYIFSHCSLLGYAVIYCGFYSRCVRLQHIELRRKNYDITKWMCMLYVLCLTYFHHSP